MSRYLVTGGCGFIGSHLVDRLSNDGHEVRILDNLSSGKMSNIRTDAEIIIGDIFDYNTVLSCMQGVDGCFHLAAIASVQKAGSEWSKSHFVNQSATIMLLEASIKSGRNSPIPVVFASTAAVYGNCQNLPLSEELCANPISAYGVDKLASELHGNVGANSFDIPFTAMRFFNVYGHRQAPDSPYSGVITIFLNRILAGKDIDIFGSGMQSRDFIYVEDVVDGLIAAMRTNRKGFRCFNLCTGQAVSVLDLGKIIMGLVGKTVNINYLPVKTGDIMNSYGDYNAALSCLQFKPKHSLEEGLRKAISLQVREAF